MENIIVELEQIKDSTFIQYSFEIDKLNREKFNNSSELLRKLSSICMLKFIDIKDIKVDESILVNLSKLTREERLGYKLKSRLADILWLNIKDKEKVNYLKIAIGNYMKYPLNIVFQNEWDRAIFLLISTKQNIDTMKEKLLETFKETNDIDNIFVDFLRKYDKKAFKYENSLLIEIFDKKISMFDSIYDKQDFLEKYMEFYIDKDLKYNELVDYYNKTIEANNLDEIIGYAKIINCLNKIKDKQKYNVSEQLRKFQNKKIEFQKNISYQKIEVSINIEEYVKETEELLKNKSTIEILYQLGSFEDKIIDILEDIKENDEEVFLESISGDIGVFNSEGRKVLENLSPKYKYYSDYINLFLHSIIFPTLKILSNHSITQEQLLELCQKSSLVPKDRIKTWSKGLYYGFKQDFIISTSLLAPQIEHLLRSNLKNIGKNTINHKGKDGVEEEIGIDRLLDNNIKNFNQIIYEEFKLILTSPFNLRNDVAHGLISDEYFNTQFTIYFWWLVFKLIITDIIDNEAKL